MEHDFKLIKSFRRLGASLSLSLSASQWPVFVNRIFPNLSASTSAVTDVSQSWQSSSRYSNAWHCKLSMPRIPTFALLTSGVLKLDIPMTSASSKFNTLILQIIIIRYFQKFHSSFSLTYIEYDYLIFKSLPINNFRKTFSIIQYT